MIRDYVVRDGSSSSLGQDTNDLLMEILNIQRIRTCWVMIDSRTRIFSLTTDRPTRVLCCCVIALYFVTSISAAMTVDTSSFCRIASSDAAHLSVVYTTHIHTCSVLSLTRNKHVYHQTARVPPSSRCPLPDHSRPSSRRSSPSLSRYWVPIPWVNTTTRAWQ